MRSVPSEMQEHLNDASTTTCRLLKIKTKNGVIFGLTNLDVEVRYDDGGSDGQVTYVATRGFDPSILRAELGVNVDNGETTALLSDTVEGVTQQMIDAGELDDATWVCLLVNFRDVQPDGSLTAARHVELNSGDLGDVRARDGMVYITELLDTTVRLSQTIGEVTSRKCRATFGLPATPENRQRGCGVDAEPLWVYGEVTAVGAETDRQFDGDMVVNSPPVTPVPGRVQFLSGANAGREFAVDTVSGNTVTLIETTGYPIEEGDTYRIRPDCAKRYLEDCIGVWDNGVNFKGEPNIPDGSDVAAPR